MATTLNLPEDKDYLADAMQQYGGSFVQALGAALRRADRANTYRILATWPEYVGEYTDWALALKEFPHD